MQNKKENKYGFKKILVCFSMMLLGSVMFIVPALATAPNASTTMFNLISLMLSMFKYVGAAIFVWAIIQFILATKRSDADSKGRCSTDSCLRYRVNGYYISCPGTWNRTSY